MAHLISVNVAVPRPSPERPASHTGIDRRPVDGPVQVTAPEPGRPGLAGDVIGEPDVHGGVDKAVYVYAREDLDIWQAELGRPLDGGVFGENLTTAGIDVTGARMGERWRVGAEVVLEVSVPRFPCRNFAYWMDEPDWIKRFTARGRPGTYLRVVSPGEVRAGDEVVVESRPDHDVTVGVVFQALTVAPDLLPRLLAVDTLPAAVREKVRRRTAA